MDFSKLHFYTEAEGLVLGIWDFVVENILVLLGQKQHVHLEAEVADQNHLNHSCTVCVCKLDPNAADKTPLFKK